MANLFIKFNQGILVSLLVLTHGQVAAQEADPTRPPTRVQSTLAPVVEIRDLQLTSIWYRATDVHRPSTAVINGQRVTVGDSVGDYEVVEIEPDQVTLANQNGEVLLKVFRSSSLTIERH